MKESTEAHVAFLDAPWRRMRNGKGAVSEPRPEVRRDPSCGRRAEHWLWLHPRRPPAPRSHLGFPGPSQQGHRRARAGDRPDLPRPVAWSHSPALPISPAPLTLHGNPCCFFSNSGNQGCLGSLKSPADTQETGCNF